MPFGYFQGACENYERVSDIDFFSAVKLAMLLQLEAFLTAAELLSRAAEPVNDKCIYTYIFHNEQHM